MKAILVGMAVFSMICGGIDLADAKEIIVSKQSEFLLPRISELVKNMERVEIIYIPQSLLTTIAINQEGIENGYSYKLSIRNGIGLSRVRGSLEKALACTHVELTKKDSDLRWGVIFFDSNERRLASIYFNQSGSSGYVDSAKVSFKKGFFCENLFDWINKNFSSDLR